MAEIRPYIVPPADVPEDLVSELLVGLAYVGSHYAFGFQNDSIFIRNSRPSGCMNTPANVWCPMLRYCNYQSHLIVNVRYYYIPYDIPAQQLKVTQSIRRNGYQQNSTIWVHNMANKEM